jgi:hypothetical protein
MASMEASLKGSSSSDGLMYVEQEDEEHYTSHVHQSHSFRKALRGRWGFLGIILVLTLSAIAFGWAVHALRTGTGASLATPIGREVMTCGKTPEEARARGCRFQLWAYAWIPEPCYDAELDQEFLDMYTREHKQQNWGYYRERNATTWDDDVPLSELLKGEGEGLWSTEGQHWWHCAFYQKKFYRALEKANGDISKIVDAGFAERELQAAHALHCAKTIPKGIHDMSKWKELGFRVHVGFQYC